MEIEGRKESPVNFSRVELLVDVYFPSINEVFAQTQSERDKFHNIAQEHKRAYENGDLDGRRFLLPFGEAMKSIDEIGSHLLKAVVECIRTVAC